jgi:PST family polysaccharide transporter
MSSTGDAQNSENTTSSAEPLARAESELSESSNLKATVVRGGILLALRQAFSVVIGVLGFLILARIVGPTEYGRYTTAFGIHAFIANTAQTGIGVFLIRGSRELEPRTFHAAGSFLVIAGCVAALIEIFVLPRAGALIGLGQAMPILVALACALPVNLLTVPVQARFERKLDYRRIAIVQITSQLAFYAVALPFAIAGYGAWSLAAGLIFQQILECVAYHAMARWLPRPAWDWDLLKDMLGYSAGFSTASLLWAAKGLVNPIIVGSLLGIEAVAFVALAIRIIDMLNFVKNATWQ